MDSVLRPAVDIARLWERARSGDLRGAQDAAHAALAGQAPSTLGVDASELRLVAAFCAMRQGAYADALRELDAAADAEASSGGDGRQGLRIEAWRAELAYFRGHYSEADRILDRVTPRLEEIQDLAHAAFALRTRIAILLARVDYDAITALADHAIRTATASGDRYVMVQVYNVLGAALFDRATSKLNAPHARTHMTSIDPRDAAPMEADARAALRLFETARDQAVEGGYTFAAWYVSGNIERLEILLGHADRAVRAIRKRLGVLQAKGARYDEIVTRSNLAWGLRTLGRHREALHELDVAQRLVRSTGTFNVLLEFIEYDRSVVLDALGDANAARASYRRYLQLVGAFDEAARQSPRGPAPGERKRPLEPAFLKRADRYVAERIGDRFSIAELAAHCGVSWRTLEKSFSEFRGVTPIAYIRNQRLDRVLPALDAGDGSIAEIAARAGYRSPTTFTIEFRKRFGISPSQRRRSAAARA